MEQQQLDFPNETNGTQQEVFETLTFLHEDAIRNDPNSTYTTLRKITHRLELRHHSTLFSMSLFATLITTGGSFIVNILVAVKLLFQISKSIESARNQAEGEATGWAGIISTFLSLSAVIVLTVLIMTSCKKTDCEPYSALDETCKNLTCRNQSKDDEYTVEVNQVDLKA